jgi:hypothetical protein
MNYLLSFVVLCFLLSGCAAMGIQVGKTDNSESFKAGQVPQVMERGPGNASAKIATANDPHKAVKASFPEATHPDQF